MFEPIWAGEIWITRLRLIGGMHDLLYIPGAFWGIYTVQYAARATETPADDRPKSFFAPSTAQPTQSQPQNPTGTI